MVVANCHVIQVIESASGKEISNIRFPAERTDGISILSDGETLLMRQNGYGKLVTYNFVTAQFTSPLSIEGEIWTWQVSPNEKLLFVKIYSREKKSSNYDKVWNLGSNQRLAQFKPKDRIKVWDKQLTAFSPDNTRLALLYTDHIEIRATETGELLNQLNWDALITGITFGSLRLQPDSTQTALLISTQNGEIRALNPATRAQIASFTLDTNAITAFNLHPNSRLLAAASNIEPKITMLQVYDVQQKTLVFGLTLSVTDGYDDPLDAQALAFSTDGTALLAIFDELNNYQPRFYAWDLRTAAAIEPCQQNLVQPVLTARRPARTSERKKS